MTMLHNNNPLLELNENNDLFGTLEKAKTIKSFVESYMHCFGEGERNKIIALYGPWGCGKTSLMHFLEKKIEPPVSIFFETWKYEKDGNLELSLLDAIANEIPNESKKKKTRAFLRAGAELLISTAKAFSFNAGPISFSANTLLSNIDKNIKHKGETLSFATREDNFRKEFEKIENEILTGQPDTAKLIVYIDDLDRCEPENALSLMVALKHFFSLGKRTIFFCGIDKEAIGQAIKTKYHDIIQPDEYLEKIVDVSFSMPRTFDLRQFVKLHFKKPHVDLITKFFTEIGFTNARKLKKVMNKYMLLKHIKEKKLHGHELILEQDNTFSIIITLYFIVIYVFNRKQYFEIRDIDKRKLNFREKYLKYCERRGKESSNQFIIKKINEMFPYNDEPLRFVLRLDAEKKFINTFVTESPLDEIECDIEIPSYMLQFHNVKNSIPVGFGYFYIQNTNELQNVTKDIDVIYKFLTLFDMVETLL